ncbi:helix-turn-helix domain-containing protein [Kiritimatiellaeota bacterium B1221]|nr:helix-turn-helix domain-containing protein [Kiritimatiellaeota bacterium B1221]
MKSELRTNMTAEPWISLEDIAAHLSVSADSVRRWIREREMPAHKAGGVWRFKVSEVDRWVRAGDEGKGRSSA